MTNRSIALTNLRGMRLVRTLLGLVLAIAGVALFQFGPEGMSSYAAMALVAAGMLTLAQALTRQPDDPANAPTYTSEGTDNPFTSRNFDD